MSEKRVGYRDLPLPAISLVTRLVRLDNSRLIYFTADGEFDANTGERVNPAPLGAGRGSP